MERTYERCPWALNRRRSCEKVDEGVRMTDAFIPPRSNLRNDRVTVVFSFRRLLVLFVVVVD